MTTSPSRSTRPSCSPGSGAFSASRDAGRRRRLALLLACAGLLVASGSRAGDAVERLGAHGAQIDVGFTYETLDRDVSDWGGAYFVVREDLGNGRTLRGGLLSTRRFEQGDLQVHAGHFGGLGGRWLLDAEGGISPTGVVLPRWYLQGHLVRPLGRGWVAGGGLRTTSYATSDVLRLAIDLERYWGRYRLAYVFWWNRLDGGTAGGTHRWQVDRYHRGRDVIGLGFSLGREVESLATGVLATDVRTLFLVGRFRLRPDWAVIGSVTWHDQGDLYTRKGVQLGLRREQ